MQAATTTKKRPKEKIRNSSIVWSFCTEPTHPPIHTKRKKKRRAKPRWKPGIQRSGGFYIQVAPIFDTKKEGDENVKSRSATPASSGIGKAGAGCEKTNHGATALQPRRGFVFFVTIDAAESEIESFAALISQTWDVADDGRFGLYARRRDGLGV